MAATAAACPSSPISVIRDCSEDGVLNGKYSASELERRTRPAPIGPRRVHGLPFCDPPRPARIGGWQATGKAEPDAAADRVDSVAPPTPGEAGEIAKAAGADGSVRIGGTGVRPGESGAAFDSAGFGTDLPPLVLIVLIALGASTLAVAALTGRRHLGGVKRGISRFRR